MNKEVGPNVKEEILLFFQVNGERIDKILLWKTFKAYIQGGFISQGAYGKKKRSV